MSTSSKETLQDEAPNLAEKQNNQQAKNVSPVDLNAKWSELQSLSISMPTIKDSQEYKDLEAKIKQTVEKTPAKQTPAAPAKPQSKADEGAGEEEEEEDNKPKNPFSRKKATSAPEVIGKIDKDVFAEVAKEFGIGVDDPAKFFGEVVPKWRNDSQELPKVMEEKEALEKDLAALPEGIKTQISAFFDGKNWMDEAKNLTVRPDFNQDADKIDPETLVKYYHKEKYKTLQKKYEDGDYDEDDYKDRLELLKDAAKPLFERDKQAYHKKLAELSKNAEENEKTFRASINSSVDSLTKKYHGFEKSQIQKIKNALATGNIDSLLRDKNGAYKSDAAERVAYMLYGDAIFEEETAKAESKGRTEANLEIVEKGKKTIENSKAIENDKKQAEAKAVQHLSMLNSSNKDPYA